MGCGTHTRGSNVRHTSQVAARPRAHALTACCVSSTQHIRSTVNTDSVGGGAGAQSSESKKCSDASARVLEVGLRVRARVHGELNVEGECTISHGSADTRMGAI